MSLDVGDDGGLAETLVRVMPGTLPPSASVATNAFVVSVKGCAFEPHVALVAPGQAVAFRNESPVPQNASGYNLDSSESVFDLAIPPRASTTVNLATVAPLADTIVVLSDVHPWTRNLLYVVDPQWSRITDNTGAFVIDGVPPGEHDVQAYHDGDDAMRGQMRHVVVPADGADVRVDFTYPRK
jgi:plastocyanin